MAVERTRPLGLVQLVHVSVHTHYGTRTVPRTAPAPRLVIRELCLLHLVRLALLAYVATGTSWLVGDGRVVQLTFIRTQSQGIDALMERLHSARRRRGEMRDNQQWGHISGPTAIQINGRKAL